MMNHEPHGYWQWHDDYSYLVEFHHFRNRYSRHHCFHFDRVALGLLWSLVVVAVHLQLVVTAAVA